jgi:hypothetical protein
VFVDRAAMLVVAAILGTVVGVLSYLLAVVATDEWAATVRAQVDLGRIPVAAAFGLRIPDDLEEERRMWSYVNLFVSVPYAHTGAATAWLNTYRATPAEEPSSSPVEQSLAQLAAANLALARRVSPQANGDPVAEHSTRIPQPLE